MRQSESPLSSPTSLRALADDLEHVVEAVDAASNATPFAAVEQTPDGPRLIVGGVYVRWWMSQAYAADATRLAELINAAFAERLECASACRGHA
jgi:hypothetical protein